MLHNYLQILQESLQKKLEILDQIELKSLEQAKMLKAEEIELSAIDLNMDEKAELISKLIKLDEGFEHLYDRIREELIDHKESYKSEILSLKGLISKVTEKSASIQAIEVRNKAQIDIYCNNQKRSLQSRKTAMSVARDYYQNMNKVKHVSPQFLDQKK